VEETYGFHPLLAFLDRPEVAGGEALAGLLRAGNAGSNTADDHVQVLEMALAQLPDSARPGPRTPSPRHAASGAWNSPSGSLSMSASRTS
jgi:hypothetical protein